MTINTPEAFVASLWDWGCLDGCFGTTRIRPTDIDGAIERHGRFLFLETKLPGVPIGEGQRIFFTAIANTGFASVLFIWGHPGTPEQGELWHLGRTHTYPELDIEKLRAIVTRWFMWADTTQKPNLQPA